MASALCAAVGLGKLATLWIAFVRPLQAFANTALAALRSPYEVGLSLLRISRMAETRAPTGIIPLTPAWCRAGRAVLAHLTSKRKSPKARTGSWTGGLVESIAILASRRPRPR